MWTAATRKTTSYSSSITATGSDPVKAQSIAVYRTVQTGGPGGPRTAVRRTSFSRGEAVAQIGSSKPIWVTDVECGQKPHKMVLFTDFLREKSFKKSVPYGATYPPARIPHPSQNSPEDYFDPPSPREKVRGFAANQPDKLKFEFLVT
jgi:hypothetical protein